MGRATSTPGSRGGGGSSTTATAIDAATSWMTSSTPATNTRRAASRSTLPTTTPSPSTTPTGALAVGQVDQDVTDLGACRHPGRVPVNGAAAIAVDGRHHRLDGQHLGPGDVAHERPHVVVGRCYDHVGRGADLHERPSRMMAMRSPRRSASERSWVMNTIVVAHLAAQADDLVLHLAVGMSGSSAENGSSNRSTSGPVANARASPTRCCMPPES